jgi:pimeloyl-ACP methyl ester carboxylesterase
MFCLRIRSTRSDIPEHTANVVVVIRKTFVATCAAAAVLGSSASAASAAETEFDLTTPTGTLFGTLLVPAGSGPVPVALIVAGSGPTDRNGNNPAFALNIYQKLANALADHGIASVRYDKRGIAASRASGGSEEALRFETYIDDAAAFVTDLRRDKRFSSVALIGHSEGSLVGMVAAQHAPVDRYVSLEGAGFPAAVVLRKQLAAQLASSPDLLAQSNALLDRLVSGSTVADVPATLAPLFRASVQPYLISWFKYDPRIEIAKLSSGVTIVQGTHDLQVPVEDGKALAAANPKAAFVLVDGMTHVLSDDPGTSLQEQVLGAYIDAARPLDPRMLAALVTAVR